MDLLCSGKHCLSPDISSSFRRVKRWHKDFVHSGQVRHTCLHPLQTLAASVPLFALRLSRPTPAWPLFLFVSVIMGSSGHSSQEFHLQEQRCCHCVLQLLTPLKRLFCFMASDQIQPMEMMARWKKETETGVRIPLMSSLLRFAMDCLIPLLKAQLLSIKLLWLAYCNHSLLLTP